MTRSASIAPTFPGLSAAPQSRYNAIPATLAHLQGTNMLDLRRLPEAIRTEGGVSRRLFLAYGAALSSLPLLGRATWAAKSSTFSSDPFTLGVASGDSDARGVVLWTRLAPRPLDPDGGMPALPVEVRWEVAEDDAFTKGLHSGTAIAAPQLGHSVHVDLSPRLEPDRWYFYRFHAGDATSPVGRTRTMPGRGSTPERLRFAFASCQHYETGLYTAYEQMAKDDLDLVFHLGDYIYEDGGRDGHVRKHANEEVVSLADYRVRYSQYRSDPLLQAMHTRCPWFVTTDDHEVDNNYAGSVSEKPDVTPAELLLRRANAYQAYYEMMPLRARSLPFGPDMRLYRHASFGRLADFFVLDTRQYRTDQPNDARRSSLETGAAPQYSLLGTPQRNWLMRELLRSHGTWNVLAQQVMMGLVGFRNREAEGLVYSMDQWPSASHERRQLLEFIANRRVPNPVVLTGDIHSNWVNNLRIDDRQPETAVVATEFVGTSISSGGDGVDRIRTHDELLADNPCVQFHNAQRGYCRCTVTPETWTSDYIVVDEVSKPGGKVSTRATFVAEAGAPGAHPA